MTKWISLEDKPTTDTDNLIVLVQYAPGPATTQSIVSYYRDNTFYSVETGQPITAPILSWAPIKPGN
jgi:hypothetical protein